jgi:hypothetical protein
MQGKSLHHLLTHESTPCGSCKKIKVCVDRRELARVGASGRDMSSTRGRPVAIYISLFGVYFRPFQHSTEAKVAYFTAHLDRVDRLEIMNSIYRSRIENTPRDGEAVNCDGLISSFPFLARKVHPPPKSPHIYPFVSKYGGGRVCGRV